MDSYFRQLSSYPLKERTQPLFSSEWFEQLKSRGLIPRPEDELDWSGNGQHVEYTAITEKEIPLVFEKTLGSSATAVVDSVRCRRIRLARKKIRCRRPLSRLDYLAEVEHLQRLQHAHVVRVVGTYTWKKDLGILLYPAAPWNLDEFMDELMDEDSMINTDALIMDEQQEHSGIHALRTFFGCLARALAFIHHKNVKHMDIKPKNILVRPLSNPKGEYKVYIADFGIARAYKSAQDAETNSPTSFTRTYAAPEVASQDTRGFSADMFSLGCVFLEMMATLVSKGRHNERQRLAHMRTVSSRDSSYQANLDTVEAWFDGIVGDDEKRQLLSEDLLSLLPKMIEHEPQKRPSAAELDQAFEELRCGFCDDGPEPFEAASEL
ncbi:kinase-like protein [Setomelanomma holmii]|uniref:Kinase-like protein n=1 Tax=Setomelanomma holmii TaxID=210430 RepID=A0A9P4HKB6_9PLEO|nr:kinase-like protein [Setomelanomma holmii]